MDFKKIFNNDLVNILYHYLVNANLDSRDKKIQNLIENGVDINHKDDNGKSLLHHLCENNEMEAVEKLIEHGADINSSINSDGKTLLHQACINGNQDLA